MNEQEFKNRTKKLALDIIQITTVLPRSRATEVIARQLLRSGTSVGANYRAVCRSKSTADMIHKLSIVEEEADETHYWIELLVDAKLIDPTRVSALMQETHEITAMIVASLKTLRSRNS
jgi:four helix bundle protein